MGQADEIGRRGNKESRRQGVKETRRQKDVVLFVEIGK
jgi:hypothetical protein